MSVQETKIAIPVENINIKTKYYIDVERPIEAGMRFGSKDYKMRVVGHRVTRLYFDTKEKDCQVGFKFIKFIPKKGI